jgi:hypothetical protein
VPRPAPPPPRHPAGKGEDSTKQPPALHRERWAPPGDTRPARRRPLLRKEVIQPHLPVRLPCYDFVPIADPTFDGSLPLRG